MPINSRGRSLRRRSNRAADGSIHGFIYIFGGVYVRKPRPKHLSPRGQNGEVKVMQPADPEKLARLREEKEQEMTKNEMKRRGVA